MSDSIQSQGGKARAAVMSPEARSKCAADAANARWKNKQPKSLDLLISKFPDFDTGWDEPTRQAWFDAFNKIITLCAPRS